MRRRWSWVTVALLVALVMLMFAVPGAEAIAPLVILGGVKLVLGALSMLISIVMTAINIAKIVAGWALFLFIVVVLGGQFFVAIKKLGILAFLINIINRAAFCPPIGPSANSDTIRGEPASPGGQTGMNLLPFSQGSS